MPSSEENKTRGEDICDRLSNLLKEKSQREALELLDKEMGTFKEEGKELYAKDIINAFNEYRGEEDETLMHLAVKYENMDLCPKPKTEPNTEHKSQPMPKYEPTILEILIDLCPELLYENRHTSNDYKGQSPLHLAIARKNIQAVSFILNARENVSSGQEANEDKTALDTQRLLKQKATGPKFMSTVMMGESPLSIAALTFNSKMVRVLLKRGADIQESNSRGDTVLHTLVRYASFYPDKIKSVIKMFRLFIKEIERSERKRSGKTNPIIKNKAEEKNEKRVTKTVGNVNQHPRQLRHASRAFFIWSIENDDQLTALQLSVQLGVVEVFEFIINIEDVHWYLDNRDILDIKLYDITTIDTITNSIYLRKKSQAGRMRTIPKKRTEGVKYPEGNCTTTCTAQCPEYPKTESIMDMIFSKELDSTDAFDFLKITPVKNLVDLKWETYSVHFRGWFLLHLVTMAILTAYCIIKPDVIHAHINHSFAHSIAIDFVQVAQWIGLVVGLLYFLVWIMATISLFRQPNIGKYFLHNLEYNVLLLLFSSCLLTDTIITQTDQSSIGVFIPLILALIFGWWFVTFFLRAYGHFSFFTALIKDVIVGDFFRFTVIILLQVFGFTSGMYVMLRTSHDIETPGSDWTFGNTLFIMFKLMLGLADIDTLSETRSPFFSNWLFIFFALLTYVLLFNALIAMMSQTCADVSTDRDQQCRYQRLSVVLFIESLLPRKLLRRKIKDTPLEAMIVSYPDVHQTQTEKRYFLEIHSLGNDKALAKNLKTRKLRTSRFYVFSTRSQKVDIGPHKKNKKELDIEFHH